MLVKDKSGDILELKITHQITPAADYHVEIRRGGLYQRIVNMSFDNINRLFNEVNQLADDLKTGKVIIGTEYGNPIVLLNWKNRQEADVTTETQDKLAELTVRLNQFVFGDNA